MQKRISDGNAVPINVVIIGLDSVLRGAMDRARPVLEQELPGLNLKFHAAVDWDKSEKALASCRADIVTGDIILVAMLFVENQIQAVMPDLMARRENCEAMIACMSAAEIVKLTRLGRFDMQAKPSAAINLLKKLKGSGGQKDRKCNQPIPCKSQQACRGLCNSGENRMAMLRRLPAILKYIPGSAQDVRAYFMVMQYWLACSDVNLASLVRFLIQTCAAGDRLPLRSMVQAAPPIDYPDVGLYHPRLGARTVTEVADLPEMAVPEKGRVGLILLRSYVLAGDAGHYDGVITALERRGLRAIPAFANGLDSRPAVEKFFQKDGTATVDAMICLTGFSLVGGPAYNDSVAASKMLDGLNVPCLSGHALEFQTLDQWRGSDQGLMPFEATIMVAIPELDGVIAPSVYGGRRGGEVEGGSSMVADPVQVDVMVRRVEKIVSLRQTERAKKKIAVVLFNFPPNSGATGTAAFLSVFESLFNTLTEMKAQGYTVGDLPQDADALRALVLSGNSDRYGTDANVHATISVDDHVRNDPYLKQIEACWGPAPGRQLTDGRSLFVLGMQFGNVLVAVQPGFGYEGDPMRMLFEKDFAPTHAFSAFYRYLREEFQADAALHFGTHGALEFMPGKQAGMSATCWPERLIGSMPNFYLYAANNPSEGTIAKRRSAATLISYMTPPVHKAGLYKGLIDLKASLDRWRSSHPDDVESRMGLAEIIQSQAVALDLAEDNPQWGVSSEPEIFELQTRLRELEATLIPDGLHIVGQGMSQDARIDLLELMSQSAYDQALPRSAIQAIVAGADAKAAAKMAGLSGSAEEMAALAGLVRSNALLAKDHELGALIHALDGGYVRPVPGGDILRTPEIIPTGRNLHGFDPFRLPSAFAVEDGARQATRLIERHVADGNCFPESVAMVLWGTDNLKSEGGPIGQALALFGAKPRFDSFGRLVGASLIPLEELGRPRIDVVMTLSGIFRDLLPLQTKLLAQAALMASKADEPLDMNFVRKHSLAYQVEKGCDMDTAALRVFSNSDGNYGSNVNGLVGSGQWQDEGELGAMFTEHKSFAYGVNGSPQPQKALMNTMLAGVQLAYQNLESVEVGVTTIDHYFDTLGGITRAAKTASGGVGIPVYIGDQTSNDGKIRTLTEQVSLEARTRMLNPTWYEGMLKHGYEGVREIEACVTNTLGWSATTGQVTPWVFKQITETYVLDPDMRRRMAELNPKASARVANRLLEAHERNYWTPDPETLAALQAAGDELEDRLEGINAEAAA